MITHFLMFFHVRKPFHRFQTLRTGYPLFPFWFFWGFQGYPNALLYSRDAKSRYYCFRLFGLTVLVVTEEIIHLPLWISWIQPCPPCTNLWMRQGTEKFGNPQENLVQVISFRLMFQMMVVLLIFQLASNHWTESVRFRDLIFKKLMS